MRACPASRPLREKSKNTLDARKLALPARPAICHKIKQTIGLVVCPL